jgi:hypothetical protein
VEEAAGSSSPWRRSDGEGGGNLKLICRQRWEGGDWEMEEVASRRWRRQRSSSSASCLLRIDVASAGDGAGTEGGAEARRLEPSDAARREIPQECSCTDDIAHFAAALADTAGGATLALLYFEDGARPPETTRDSLRPSRAAPLYHPPTAKWGKECYCYRSSGLYNRVCIMRQPHFPPRE